MLPHCRIKKWVERKNRATRRWLINGRVIAFLHSRRSSTVLILKCWNGLMVHVMSLTAAFYLLGERKPFCNENKPLPSPAEGRDLCPARRVTLARGDGSSKGPTDSGPQREWSGSRSGGWVRHHVPTWHGTVAETWKALFLHYYGQRCCRCWFAFEGNKHASGPLVHTQTNPSLTSGNYSGWFIIQAQLRRFQIIHNVWPDTAICFPFDKCIVLVGKNRPAGGCHSCLQVHLLPQMRVGCGPVISKGQCPHFNIAEVSHFQRHRLPPMTPTPVPKWWCSMKCSLLIMPRGLFCGFLFLLFFFSLSFVWFIYRTIDG